MILRIYSFIKENMQNYAQIRDIDHYSLHNIFIISVSIINYLFLYLIFLVKPELSMHCPVEYQNISFVS